MGKFDGQQQLFAKLQDKGVESTCALIERFEDGQILGMLTLSYL